MLNDKRYPANHKTLFLLDHTPYFGIPCECLIEFDFTKSRGPGFIPLAPISKSLWTCSVEAAIEYCRIVWDIFPEGKLVRFVVSDSTAHVLNSWNQSQQNLTHLLSGLSAVGVPPSHRHTPPNEYTVVHGIRAAVKALSESSEIQHEKRNSLNETASMLLNNCRVICLTSARDNISIKSIQEIFLNELVQVNKIAASSDHLIPVNNCHLVIINVYPNNMENVPVTPHPLREISNLLSCEVHCAKAGGQIASKLSHLILSHYDLASTTVTGIPMKEEQNASSSANYDVEIFHPSQAHTALLKGHSADVGMIKEGTDYESVTLKWCTPRGCSAAEMHNCTAMFRVTPVDVNSRPSSCLINFLLNGRSVMLEMIRRGGGKMISHLLAAHGGEIFIHSLVTGRSILEDPPSISEGCGGRVTDYRITDFGMLMQMNKLFPLRLSEEENKPPWPIDKMKERLNRFTKYWPLTISNTSIFNFKMYMEPLLSVMVSESLTDDEVVQCKQCIYTLMTLESKHEPLQATTAIGHHGHHGHRGKGPKRDEQYHKMWNELETYLRSHLHSDQHSRVLHCLLECRNKEIDDKTNVELDQALRELDQFPKDSTASRSGTPTLGGDAAHRASVIRATTDSPLSPPPQASAASGRSRPYPAPRTLLELLVSRQNADNSKHKRPDFVGRVTAEPLANGGSLAKLYPNLKLVEGAGRDVVSAVLE
ncbi:integrator complex subunit 13 [Nilaparvata lugens]|uniref:integrator complex subunit 13 n=1 Tax=Nilaparvata lugens TaxID=108931 RepID=UPI00193DD155|nr:integrator complex subunit 13 [Nilaparvata lugens]